MKFSASMLLLATSALASQVEPRGGDDYDNYGHDKGKTTTLTTYTTVTTCPVTSTYTNKGSTYYVTQLTTSTIIVTDCYGCGVTTVQGPDVTKTEYDTEYTTYTTVCPVTETKTVGGEETTITYITTSTVTEKIGTTYYEEYTQPGATETEVDTEYTTYTTVCPVTEVKTVEGKPTTLVYTTTSTVTEKIGTTYYEEYTKPGATETAVDTEYTTYTTVCPVTEVKTVEGKPTTLVYTTTSTVTEKVGSTVYEEYTKPGATEYATETALTTYTTVCPVTEVKTIEGEETTIIYTTTSVVTEKVGSTVYEEYTKPGETEYAHVTQYSTYTTVCPVTEVKTIEGEETTIVYTTTSTIVEAVKSTAYEEYTLPGTTEYVETVAYVTSTSLCPVTETKTIEGEEVTVVYTSTQYIVKTIKTTLEEYKTIYKTASEVDVETHYSKVYYTVGGGTVIETIIPETTVQIPQTEIVTQPAVTVSTTAEGTPAPSQITGAAVVAKPAFALMAGMAGAILLL